ncbi:MAG: succinate dehydrogenase/fumarate reductase iron-sulfur subunit [Halodesulfurarchaeum sp.]
MSTDTPETETDEVPEPQLRRLEKKAQTPSDGEAEASGGSETGEETVHLQVFRYDPDDEDGGDPHFEAFHVENYEGMTVLDALMTARDDHDPSLTFRHSCRQAVCGSDALFVNGNQMLACQNQVEDLSEPIRIEPLPHRPVIKDLVVDMEHFYEQMHSVDPYFDPDDLPEDELTEQRQSRENREKIKMSTRCIWCGACMSSCNIAAGDNQYLGPAAINKAYRFYFDEREGEDRQEERLETMSEEHAVWRCQTQFSCTEVCPKDIPLTDHIQELKREGVTENITFW